MLKLKLQYFGHLMRRVDSLEKTMMRLRPRADGGVRLREEVLSVVPVLAHRHHEGTQKRLVAQALCAQADVLPSDAARFGLRFATLGSGRMCFRVPPFPATFVAAPVQRGFARTGAHFVRPRGGSCATNAACRLRASRATHPPLTSSAHFKMCSRA